MSNSNVPAYILEARQKGEDYVTVLRRVSYSPEREDYQEFKIRTAEAIKIFSKPSTKRNMNERRIKPLGQIAQTVAPVADASSLGTDAILAELAKRGVQIPSVIAEPEAEKPKRGRKPKEESETTDETDSTETINPETEA